ncbi:MAG: hypothetical protein A2622_03165 [Bdellovibrionales bacterium RIFCSPHIGHO2_01_FULL_40_29]|nr:MAG: hypothetical protein A2622_03165 [Bdellovibrionales bacterium RIFCSPHIGHO2_01_FULL_40_29]OFZ34073.1 MAG: hypothetical protein A3D17_03585 [Bdellovibrionales bacterium RIFCSPHIGHO2_02_FULL_40_15]
MSQKNFAFGQVQKHLGAKKYYAALSHLSSLSLQYSKDIEFLTLLSETQAGLKDFTNLIKTQSEIVRQRGSTQDKISLMRCYYRANQRNHALDVGLELQSQTLSTIEEQVLSKLLVKIFLEENDFEGAQEVITRALMSEADDFLLWAQGIVLLNCDNKERALDYFRKAVQLNPRNDQAWVSLAMMHKDMGDEDLYVANLEKAIDLNPYNAAALKLLAGSTQRKSERVTATFEHLRFYLAEYCFDEDISLCHIQMLCQVKQWDIAELEIEKLLLNEPESQSFKKIKKSMFEAQNLC